MIESGCCFDGDGRAVLHAAMYECGPGVWQVTVGEVGASAMAASHHDNPDAARSAMRLVYAIGSTHGHWRIEHHQPAIGKG